MSDYGSKPCYGELIAILLVGLGHILVELVFSGAEASAYNVIVSMSFVAYLAWRIRTVPGVLRHWGFRRDNLLTAFRAHMPFVAVGIVTLIVFAVLTNYPGLPNTFWLTVALYPVWGIAQQFALQNLIAANLTHVLQRPVALAAIAALLFAISHYPRMELVALTFVAGIFLTLAHRRHPNIVAVGTVHGLLGSLTFYIVLREDPGALIISLVAGG